MAAQRRTRNISIPPELDKRMDRFPEENWSAVACRAFETRLTTLEAMNTTGEGKNIARLRASKQAATDQLFQQGQRAGIAYVEVAEWEELERLDRFWDELPSYGLPDDYSIGQLAVVMDGDGDARETEDYLREKYGSVVDRASWIHGFCTGAIKKYNELRSKI